MSATTALQRRRIDVAVGPLLTLAGSMLALYLLRLALVNDYLGFTSDMGSYLMTRNWVLGNDPTGHMPLHYRPPLVGVALVPATFVFGDLLGAKLVAVSSSIAVAIPLFWAVSRWLSPWPAVFATLAIVLHPAIGEILAGGFLTIPALGLLAVGIRVLADTMEGKTRLIALALPVFLLVGLNQTVAALFFITGGAILITAPVGQRRGFMAMTIAGAIAAAWLPFYLVNIGMDFTVPGAPLWNVTPHGGALLQGMAGIAAFAVAPKANRFLIGPMLVLTLMANLSSGEAVANNLLHRAVFIQPFFAITMVGVAIQRYWRWDWRWAAPGFAALLVLLNNAAWTNAFHTNARALDMLTPKNVTVMNWVREHTEHDAKVWTHPMGLGWWVGGYVPRNWAGSWYSPLKAYQAEWDAAQCTLGWREHCDPYALRDAHSIDYLLIDESGWQQVWMMPENGWQVTAKTPWLTELHRDGPVVVYGWAP